MDHTYWLVTDDQVREFGFRIILAALTLGLAIIAAALILRDRK